MPSRVAWLLRVYRYALACSLVLVAYVVLRAPLWSAAMAGARVEVGSGQVVLMPADWTCSDRPFICSTRIGGGDLVAKVGSIPDHPIVCTATYNGHPIACAVELWYAPRLKPVIQLGKLPGVSLRAAMRERPWRYLDLGLFGESGRLHYWAGFACAVLLAIGAGAKVQRGGAWWLARIAVAVATLWALDRVWFLMRLLLGYID